MSTVWSRMDSSSVNIASEDDFSDFKSFSNMIRKMSAQRKPRTEWEQMMADVKAVHSAVVSPVVVQVDPVVVPVCPASPVRVMNQETSPFSLHHDIRQLTPQC